MSEQQERFLTKFAANGLHVADALKYAGAKRSDYHSWLTDEAFADRVQEIRDEASDNIASVAYKKALEGDTSAAKTFAQKNSVKTDPLGLGI
jgi:hypothetical protein